MGIVTEFAESFSILCSLLHSLKSGLCPFFSAETSGRFLLGFFLMVQKLLLGIVIFHLSAALTAFQIFGLSLLREDNSLKK